MKQTKIKLRSLIALGAFCLLSLASLHSSAQTIYTIAGTGARGTTGDGGAATSAKLDRPGGIAFDNQGNIYMADSGAHIIRKVNVSTGYISTIAGISGTASSTGDGTAASGATLNAPIGLVFDASGNLFIAEAGGNCIRKINTSGVISTIAGTGTASSTGDGFAASTATLNAPTGLAFDASGNLFIAEAGGNFIRKINTSGIISTIAGTGVGSSTGDGSAATSATLDAPVGVAFDGSGNLFITEYLGHTVRKINTSGIISTVTGTGAASSTGDGADATLATLRNPSGIIVDASGNIYITEAIGRRVRKINTSGIISTIAGTGTAGYTGDGGNPALATFRRPASLALNGGNIFISDLNACTIRMICDPIAPVVTASVAYCNNATATALTANGTNLKWYADATTLVSSSTAPIPSTTTAGTFTYYVSQTSFEPTCESPRAVITVTINALPTSPIVTPTLAYCQAATATALSATGSDLKWYTVSTGGTSSTTAPTPSTATAGLTDYYVTQTSAAIDGGCESPRANIAVTVNAKPAAPTVSDINVCEGGTIPALTATGTNLTWYDAATGGTASATAPTPSATIAGTFDFYVSQTSAIIDGGCESDRSNLKVYVNSFPTAPTVISTIQLCDGGSSSALSAIGTNLKWYDDATTTTSTTTAPTPSTATIGTINYYVSQSLSPAAGGCESPRALIAVTVNALPVSPTVTSTLAYCQAATATALSATGSDLKWYTVSTGGTSSSTAPTPSTATVGLTDYYVAQTSAAIDGGCESPRAHIAVTINAKPAAPTVSDINVCEGGTIPALTATGTNLTWYDAATGGTASATAPTPSSTVAGTINNYVTQTTAAIDGGCESDRSNLKVIVNSFPAAPTVTSTIQLCDGGTSTALSATGSNLQWYADPTTTTSSTSAPTPSTATVGTTTYYVSQSLSAAAGGCEGTRASIDVTVNALPAAPSITSPVDLCVKVASTALSALGSNLKWYTLPTGGTGTSVAPTPSTATTGTTDYYVTQTSAASVGSCESPRATITVQVQPSPLVSIASTSFSGLIFCAGKTINLKATAPTATTYQWQTLGTPIIGATADNFNVGTTGLSGVEVKDVYGCKATAELYVQQDTSIKPTLTPSIIKMCEGPTVIITCNPGFTSYTFNWIKDGIAMIPATPKDNMKGVNTPGTYSVIVTNNFGCIDTTGNSVVSNYPKPVKPVIVYTHPTIEVSGSYKYYQWYRNGATIISANSNKFTVKSNGQYYVEITDENGCTNNSDTITIKMPTTIGNTITKAELRLFPNPTQDIISIEAPIAINVRVNDLMGRIVFEGKNVNTISLQNQANGTYYFSISDENDQLISVEKVTKIQ